ncbi:MAG: Pr6Pr family membrane protein [Thermomicrobiales bacterium]|nr:Pr6Pr family membrane protein [Thermomicrobiales bacterium]
MLPTWIRAYRLIFGLLALVAVWWNWQEFDDPRFTSFFTHQSSALAGVVLLLGALIYARVQNPPWWDVIRGIAVIAMLVTGIVYALLLDGLYNPFTGSDHTWASSVMHQLMPIVMLLDILIVPLGARTSRWVAAIFLVYPLSYLGWFLWHGTKDEWYPYDFIDHRTYDNGYAGVCITCGMLIVLFVVIGLLIISYSRLRRMPSMA